MGSIEGVLSHYPVFSTTEAKDPDGLVSKIISLKSRRTESIRSQL